MLAIVDLNTDTLHDALESLQTVLIPWLESREPSLSEEDAEREYVKLALQVIAQYDPDLDEAKRTYFVYQLVAVLKELANSPNLVDTVNALLVDGSATQAQAAPFQSGTQFEYLSVGAAIQETMVQAPTWTTKRPAPAAAVGRLPDLPKGQPLRERPQVRYDVTPNPTDH